MANIVDLSQLNKTWRINQCQIHLDQPVSAGSSRRARLLKRSLRHHGSVQGLMATGDAYEFDG
jgi:hypothetical protein